MHKESTHFNALSLDHSGIVRPNTVTPPRYLAGLNSKLLLGLIIGAGILLRLFHYFDNRSLWTDEIYLATSLISKNFWELLTTPLAYEQKAPIGFLWMVRLAVVIFGKGEMALRLVPLLSGIGALFLFIPVARFFLKPFGVALALALLALASPIVYHSVEIKQYGAELLVTLACLWLYTVYGQKNNWRANLWWGCWGAVLLWFSYTAIFVLGGIAGAVSLGYMFRKAWAEFFRVMVPFILWLASFVINYFLLTHEHTESDWLVKFFSYYNGFMPLPPTSFTDINWFVQAGIKMLYNPLGLLWNAQMVENPILRESLKMPLVPILCLLVGGIYLFRKNSVNFMVLAFPLLLHLLASGLKLYPFMERFILFAAPILILFIAAGAQKITAYLPKRPLWQLVLPILVLAVPFILSVTQLLKPALFGDYKKSTQREALLYLNKQYQPGDAVYVYWNMLHTYRFYQDAYQLKYQAVEGRDVRYTSLNTADYFKKLAPDWASLAGKKRVWVIYNKNLDIDIGDDIEKLPQWYSNEVKGGKLLQAQFAQMGKEVKCFTTQDTNVCLFDLSAGK